MKNFVRKQFFEAEERKRLPQLKNEFGKNKELPLGYELQALLALSCYPDLSDISIIFRFVKADIPLMTRVKPSTFHLAPGRRIYVVNITNQIKKDREAILFENIDFNMQVGVLAHELAHVTDYLSKSSLQLFKTALLYPVKSYKQRLERTMDIETIHHGAGYQLLDFAKYVSSLQPQHPDDKYFSSYFSFYLTPLEIETCMQGVEGYRKQQQELHLQ